METVDGFQTGIQQCRCVIGQCIDGESEICGARQRPRLGQGVKRRACRVCRSVAGQLIVDAQA